MEYGEICKQTPCLGSAPYLNERAILFIEERRVRRGRITRLKTGRGYRNPDRSKGQGSRPPLTEASLAEDLDRRSRPGSSVFFQADPKRGVGSQCVLFSRPLQQARQAVSAIRFPPFRHGTDRSFHLVDVVHDADGNFLQVTATSPEEWPENRTGSRLVVPVESAHRGPSTMTSSVLWANNALAWDKWNGRCWTPHRRQDSIKEPIRVNAPVEWHIL